jgi:ABC-2 type transport system ATP-binding protein
VAFIREGKVLQTSSLSEFEKERLRVFIRVGQPTEQLMTELAQFGEEVKMERGNGRIQLLLPHDDHLPQLANWLIQQGHTLYELSPQRLSLEERFLQVVGNKSEE